MPPEEGLPADAPRPFYVRTRFFFVVLALIAVYAYGWKVTEFKPRSLLSDFHLIRPLLHDLVRPDLFTANSERQTVETGFALIGSRSPAPAVPPARAGEKAALVLSASAGRIGDSIGVSGSGLRANTGGELFFVNSIGQEFPLGRIATDAEGRFEFRFEVPGTARGERQTVRAVLTWKTGGFRVSETLGLTVDKMVETVFLALMATSLAILVAVPLSFLGARNLMTRHAPGTVVYYAVRTVFNLMRSIEPLILAILFAVWVGIGPFAGTLALGLHSIAALGKLFSEQIESIDSGPVEAITATGARPLQVVLYAVLPQVIPQFLALTFYRWDINVRMSTIIGFVGGGGIGFLLQQWINLLQYRKAATALLAIAAVVITLDLLSARIRERITG
ncbi:MAG: phosphonate ABC transporter, permease protein PhnE [Nitrospinaceae bacterium]|nr:MAG: phosphonate ABC transporter, permease protein PhnE [Nitrospinaceae bacterium]